MLLVDKRLTHSKNWPRVPPTKKLCPSAAQAPHVRLSSAEFCTRHFTSPVWRGDGDSEGPTPSTLRYHPHLGAEHNGLWTVLSAAAQQHAVVRTPCQLSNAVCLSSQCVQSLGPLALCRIKCLNQPQTNTSYDPLPLCPIG